MSSLAPNITNTDGAMVESEHTETEENICEHHDGEQDVYLRMINLESIRNDDGLEEGIRLKWRSQRKTLTLSTLLEPADLAPIFDGAGWAGTRVWHASICAIDYLQKNYMPSSSNKTTSLLELGCGLGVPGMVAYQLGIANNVCLTDQESIMSQLEKNVQDNFSGDSAISVRPLQWSRDCIRELLKDTSHSNGFDICLNCDCVYEPLYGNSWKLLIDVMDELLRTNPQTVMLTSVERRNGDGIDTFIHELKNALYVSGVERVFSDASYNIEIYLAKGITSDTDDS